MDDMVAEWVKYSDMDLKTAKHLHENMRPMPLEIICYLCQQSAEKALKAFLIFSGIKPEKTHDLGFLGNKCTDVDNSFSEIEESCSRLNRYSSQPRYPFEIEITDGDALLALQSGSKISEFVKRKYSDVQEDLI